MSPSLAGFLLPVFVAFTCGAIVASYAWLARSLHRALADRRLPRAPFRRRLAARLREVLHLPWAIPADGEPLTREQWLVLAHYEVAEQEKQPLAAEPEHRRQP